MRKLLITTIAFSLVAFGAGSALALCDFNAPAKAKGSKDTYVRAMAGCGGGSWADQSTLIHRAANRLGYDPNTPPDHTIGFRCARDGSSRK